MLKKQPTLRKICYSIVNIGLLYGNQHCKQNHRN